MKSKAVDSGRVVLAALIAACVTGAVGLTPLDAAAQDKAVAEMIDAANNKIGSVHFRQAPSGVLILVDLTGLPPGAHAIHLHAVGACTPDFKAAKGHINVAGRKHGLANPEGPDNGDLPNIFAAADGSAKAEIFTPLVSVSGGEAPLLDADGSAVVVHANPDNHVDQPIGGAGGRIACGVVK